MYDCPGRDIQLSLSRSHLFLKLSPYLPLSSISREEPNSRILDETDAGHGGNPSLHINDTMHTTARSKH
jgi:hypothetical protein